MSDEVTTKSNTGKIIGIGCLVVAFLAVPVIGIIAAIAIPNFVSMQNKTKAGEIPMNMNAIKVAEISYYSQFDQYVAADAYPPFVEKQAKIWDGQASGGFETIGWIPFGNVRGSYSVSTTHNDFTITGISDIDGDGINATYVATSSTNPTKTTAPDIY